MTRNYRRMRIVSVALAAALLGCQQEVAKNSPGALPAPSADEMQPKSVNATTLFAHAHLLERQGEFDRAIAQYRRAIEQKPDFVTARNRLGITLNKVGKHAEATAEFRKALESQPNSAYLLNNLGFSLYLQGDHAESLGVLRRAVELSPDFSRARMNYAVALAKTSQYDQAFEELKKVGTEADANYNLGMLLTEGARYAEAAQRFEMALAFNPKLEAARAQLREVSRLAAGLPPTQNGALASSSEPRMLSALPPAEPIMITPPAKPTLKPMALEASEETIVPAESDPATPTNTSSNAAGLTPEQAMAFWSGANNSSTPTPAPVSESAPQNVAEPTPTQTSSDNAQGSTTPSQQISTESSSATTPAPVAASNTDESVVDMRFIEMAPATSSNVQSTPGIWPPPEAPAQSAAIGNETSSVTSPVTAIESGMTSGAVETANAGLMNSETGVGLWEDDAIETDMTADHEASSAHDCTATTNVETPIASIATPSNNDVTTTVTDMSKADVATDEHKLVFTMPETASDNTAITVADTTTIPAKPAVVTPTSVNDVLRQFTSVKMGLLWWWPTLSAAPTQADDSRTD